MKWGIGISVAIVVMLGMIVFLTGKGVADTPNSETSKEKLVKQEFPQSLPALYTPSNPTADATRLYKQAIRFYQKHETDLKSDHSRTAAELGDLLIDAMNAGSVSTPFLDDVPLKAGASPEYGDALESIPGAVLFDAQRAREEGDVRYALQRGRAVFALGERAFKYSKRFYTRQQGLMTMQFATDTMMMWKNSLDDEGESLKPWQKEIDRILENWNAKMRIATGLKPHIGNLINLAKNDEDETIRARATVQLGIVKFNPQHKGNVHAIAEAIEQLKQDPNSDIATAAKNAEAMTEEELRAMR